MRGARTSGSPTNGVNLFFVSTKIVCQSVLDSPYLKKIRSMDVELKVLKQTLAVLSSEQEARYCPPGDQLTELTSSSCPINVRMAADSGVETLQI